MIGCRFQERLSYDDIRSLRGPVDAAFAKGDYPYVARFGAADPERQGMAFILIGNPRRGIEILDAAGIASADSSVLRAFALWYLGKDAKALSLLDAVIRRWPDHPR